MRVRIPIFYYIIRRTSHELGKHITDIWQNKQKTIAKSNISFDIYTQNMSKC